MDIYQITDQEGTVHLRTSDGQVVCGQDGSSWSDAETEAMRRNLVIRCDECSRRAPGLLYHVTQVAK